jgi:hypothetical protein
LIRCHYYVLIFSTSTDLNDTLVINDASIHWQLYKKYLMHLYTDRKLTICRFFFFSLNDEILAWELKWVYCVMMKFHHASMSLVYRTKNSFVIESYNTYFNLFIVSSIWIIKKIKIKTIIFIVIWYLVFLLMNLNIKNYILE